MTTHHPLTRAVTLFPVLAVCMLAGALHAAPTNFFWVNTIGGVWSEAANWTNEDATVVAPDATGQPYYNLYFYAAGTYTVTNDLTEGFLLNQLNFGGATVTLTGNGLTLTNDAGQMPQINQSASANVIVRDDILLATNVTAGGTGGGQVTLRGLLSGTGSLIKNGSYTLNIYTNNVGSPNTYSGGTVLNSGTLTTVGQDYSWFAVFGTGPITVNGGSFAPQRTGVANVNEITFNGGSWANGNAFGTAWYGPIILNTNLTINPNGTIALYGDISGPGGIIGVAKTTALYGTNTYTGGTTVTNGAVVCNIPEALAPGRLNIFTGAVARLNYTGTRTISRLTLGGVDQPFGEYGAIGSSAPSQSIHFSNSVGTVTVGIPMPFIDITNADRVVDYSITTCTVAGTNNAATVARMAVTNLLSGWTTNLTASMNWMFVAPLAVGSNVFDMYATNNAGVTAHAQALVVRGGIGTGMPFLDITNADRTVDYSITICTVAGTNNAHVVGDMWASNAANGTRVTLATASGWIAPALPLDIGANTIRVYGTNMAGTVASDSVVITRSALEAPSVDITNQSTTVADAVSSTMVGGSNNVYTVGYLQWTNSLTSSTGTLAVGAPWWSFSMPLGVGTNTITVQGTNELGIVATDSVAIIRRSDRPFVHITNDDQIVSYATTTAILAGTNNANVVGMMWVSNAAIGGVAQSFPAAVAWTTPAIPLTVGTNSIVAYGTNGWGIVTSDSVAIVRNQGAVPNIQPLLIDFSSNLVTRMISVGNDGPLPFGFTATVTSGGTWLTVAPMSGSVTNNAVSLVANADRRSLEDGQYSGEISIATTAGTTIVVRAQIAVSGNNVIAEANGPYTVNQGSPAVFSAAGTMGANLSYRWEVGLSFSSGYSSNYYSFVYTNTFIPETSDVVMTVRNTNSPPRISADSTVLVVENVPPGVDIGGPYQGNSTTPVVFTAITVDPGIFDTHQWRWDFNGDGTWDTGWLDSNTCAYTYGMGGSFMAQCEAKDNYGGVGSDSASVLIEQPNMPPVATAVVYNTTLTQTNLPGLGLPVSLSISGSFDPDDKPNPLVYDWREDVENPLKPVTLESNRNDAVITTMPLTKPGVYKFHLVVFDGEYNSQPATVIVRVPGWQGEVVCDGYLAKIPLWGVKATVTNTYTYQMRTGDSDFKGLVLADSGRGYQIAQLSRRAATMHVPIDIDDDGVFTEGIRFSPLYYVYAGQVVTGEVGHFVGVGGVNVHLLVGNGLVSRSDAMGSFGFGTVPETWPVDGAPYKVRIQKAGFRSDLVDLRLDMNRNSEVIGLTPVTNDIEISGTVCAGRSGLAVGNVALDFGNGWVATNREDGSYGPLTVPPGTYAVKLSRATFMDTYTNMVELMATATNIDLLIDGGDYSVYGEIFNALGQVITNARVEVVGNDGAVGRKMSGIENASRAGYYDVTVAKGTNRQYVVSAPGYDPQTLAVSIGGHTKQNVVLVPEPAMLCVLGILAILGRRN